MVGVAEKIKEVDNICSICQYCKIVNNMLKIDNVYQYLNYIVYDSK